MTKKEKLELNRARAWAYSYINGKCSFSRAERMPTRAFCIHLSKEARRQMTNAEQAWKTANIKSYAKMKMKNMIRWRNSHREQFNEYQREYYRRKHVKKA